MKRGTARVWREAGGRWAIQIEIDGAFYTERDYADVATATEAIGAILRQQAERPSDLDEDACPDCDEPLDLLTCSQCGADAFVRTCAHDGLRPIRLVGDAIYCSSCRV